MEKLFLRLFEENRQKLIRICMFYEKNSFDRMDLYQEIAYQVWRSLKTFRKEANINTWLYRIAINTALTYKRKGSKDKNKVPLEKYHNLKSNYNLENKTESDEQIRLLYKSIDNLNQLEKTIILLFLEGLSYKEISDITGITDNNIAVKMSRIKGKLKIIAEEQNGF